MGGAAKSVTKAVSSIFGGSSDVNVDVPDEEEAPTEDSDAVKEARRKSIIASSQRSGRSSTILTGSGSNKLGG